jgi:hypothetical protein
MALVGSAEGQISLADIRDPAKPQTLCTLTGVRAPKFASSTDISYVTVSNYSPSTSFTDFMSSIVRQAVGNAAGQTVVTYTGGIDTHAWSPDGNTLVYLVSNVAAGNQYDELVFKNLLGQPPDPVSRMPAPGRGCCTYDDVQYLQFSADGSYVVLVDGFVAASNSGSPDTSRVQVRMSMADSQAWVPPSPTSSTAAAWSRKGDVLYFRDLVGIRKWDAASSQAATIVFPGLQWYDPSLSPDGRSVSYTVRDAQDVPQVETRDLLTGTAHTVSMKSRSHPLYVDANTLWYEGEGGCTGPTPVKSCPDGRFFSYSITTQHETLLPFATVYDTWPH